MCKHSLCVFLSPCRELEAVFDVEEMPTVVVLLLWPGCRVGPLPECSGGDLQPPGPAVLRQLAGGRGAERRAPPDERGLWQKIHARLQWARDSSTRWRATRGGGGGWRRRRGLESGGDGEGEGLGEKGLQHGNKGDGEGTPWRREKLIRKGVTMLFPKAIYWRSYLERPFELIIRSHPKVFLFK